MLAFQWTAGEGMRALPLPDGVRESYAYGNNNYGVVAGAGDVGEGTRALVWSVDGPAVPELLAHSGSSIAHDVNDFGDLAGQAESGEPGAWVSRAFMLGSSGLHHSLGPATGEWSSAALTINAHGLSAGFAELDGATHAVLLDPTNGWTDVDTLDSVYSVAYGLNATGQVVGLFVASHEDEDRAFVYQRRAHGGFERARGVGGTVAAGGSARHQRRRPHRGLRSAQRTRARLCAHPPRGGSGGCGRGWW
jgi:uncharacterized membrane protein